MAQAQAKKAVAKAAGWGTRPRDRKAGLNGKADAHAADPGKADAFVRGREKARVALNTRIPADLHRRIKGAAATGDTTIENLVVETLQKRFPAS